MEFRSLRKPSYRRPEREARGRPFGFQGDLNSRGHAPRVRRLTF